MATLKFCVLLLVLVQISTVFSQGTVLDGKDEAALAISDAEEVMASAYHAVKEAEKAGADVFGFSELLKDGAQLLAQAHVSLRVGDSDSAVRFANLTSVIGNEIQVKANRLRDIRSGQPALQMWLTITQSFFAVLIIVLASFLSWRVFKWLYHRRIDTMKPEVAPDGS